MKEKLIPILLALASGAAGLTPYAHGGFADVRRGSFSLNRNKNIQLYPVNYGWAFFAGGGVSWQIKQLQFEKVLPTLSLDTEGDATFFSDTVTLVHDNGDYESFDQSFIQLSGIENLILRLRIPLGKRLLTPYLGVGAGFSAVSSDVARLKRDEDSYADNDNGIFYTYNVPFGVELSLSPQRTIYARFGPLAPAGKSHFEYMTTRNRLEIIDAEVPNSFVFFVGYRWGL